MLLTILMILAGLWLADFATGFVHWLVDTYGDPSWPVLGAHHIVYSHDHHDRPMELFTISPIARHGGIFVFVSLTGAGLALIGWLNALTISALIFGALTNTIHGWSHKSAKANGPVIRGLHILGLLQSPGHHVHHHSGQNSTHYCLLTDHVNGVLEALSFFPKLEALLTRCGLKKHWWQASAHAPLTR